MQTYRGRCHCGALKFEVDSEPIVAAIRCNCSICRRRNALMSTEYVPPERFRLLEGKDALSVYIFGDETVSHFFCARCGVYPFHSVIGDPARGRRVNLGCLEGIDLESLSVRLFDGADSWSFLSD